MSPGKRSAAPSPSPTAADTPPASGKPSPSPRPTADKVKVYVTHDHAATAADTWKAVLNADVPDAERLYVQGGKRLVTLGEVKTRTRDGAEWRTMIEGAEDGALIEATSRYVNFRKHTINAEGVKDEKSTDIPARALAVFKSRFPRRHLPDLTGIASAPVAYMHKGEVCYQTKRGYNSASGIYVDFDGGTYLTSPTLDEARKSLSNWLVDFRYDPTTGHEKMRGSDFCNAVAAALTPFVRPLFMSNVPLFWFKAPAQGSGKSKLANVLLWPYLGVLLPVSGLSESEEEREKAITSTLLGGVSVCNFDNVKGNLRSPALERLLTSSRWSARLLGGNTMVDLPNDVLWLLTANTLDDVSEDMARRSLCIQIDPGCPNPHLQKRAYMYPEQPAHTASIRPQLISCLLALVKHWVTAGRPRPHRRLEGFDDWSNVVGGILCAADMGEWWLADRDDLFDNDNRGREMRALVGLWAHRYIDQAVGTRDLIKLLDGENDLLNDVRALPTEKQPNKIGSLIAGIMGRTYDVLDTSPGSGGAVRRWKVSKGKDGRGLTAYKLERVTHTG